MYLNEMHKQVRDMTRQFANDVIRPLAEELDRDSRFPAEIYDQMAELGLFGIGVPEELGGPGFDTVTYAIVMEELSRGYASIADQCGLIELVSSLLVWLSKDIFPELLVGYVTAQQPADALCCRAGVAVDPRRMNLFVADAEQSKALQHSHAKCVICIH